MVRTFHTSNVSRMLCFEGRCHRTPLLQKRGTKCTSGICPPSHAPNAWDRTTVWLFLKKKKKSGGACKFAPRRKTNDAAMQSGCRQPDHQGNKQDMIPKKAWVTGVSSLAPRRRKRKTSAELFDGVVQPGGQTELIWPNLCGFALRTQA